MSVTEINQWVERRLKTSYGGWVGGIYFGMSDVMFCTLEAMSNRCCPKNLEMAKEYERLVEVARDYLKGNPNDKESRRLIEVVRKDYDNINSQGGRATKEIKQIFRGCLLSVLTHSPTSPHPYR